MKLEAFCNEMSCELKGFKFKSDIFVFKLFDCSEEQVFEACMRWVKHVEERNEFLPELLSQVRLPLLSPLYLTDRVATEELIRSSHQCRYVM